MGQLTYPPMFKQYEFGCCSTAIRRLQLFPSAITNNRGQRAGTVTGNPEVTENRSQGSQLPFLCGYPILPFVCLVRVCIHMYAGLHVCVCMWGWGGALGQPWVSSKIRWTDGLVVKSTSCSYSLPVFRTQHPQGSSQLYFETVSSLTELLLTILAGLAGQEARGDLLASTCPALG